MKKFWSPRRGSPVCAPLVCLVLLRGTTVLPPHVMSNQYHVTVIVFGELLLLNKPFDNVPTITLWLFSLFWCEFWCLGKKNPRPVCRRLADSSNTSLRSSSSCWGEAPLSYLTPVIYYSLQRRTGGSVVLLPVVDGFETFRGSETWCFTRRVPTHPELFGKINSGTFPVFGKRFFRIYWHLCRWKCPRRKMFWPQSECFKQKRVGTL